MLNLMRHWFYISTKGQADFRAFIQGHPFWTATYISKHLFLRNHLAVKIKFHVEYSVDKIL